MSRRYGAWVGLWLGAMACVPEPLCDDEAVLQLELGQGRDPFARFGPNVEPQVEHGLQGGVHLVLSTRLRMVSPPPEPPDVAFPLRLNLGALVEGSACPEGCRIGDVTYELEPEYAVDADDEGYLFGGLFLLLKEWPVAQTRVVEAHATDACARVAHTSVDVFPGSDHHD
ncbi:MAG: hypothetical protein AAGA48_09275 [Myxococcota bacterium]